MRGEVETLEANKKVILPMAAKADEMAEAFGDIAGLVGAEERECPHIRFADESQCSYKDRIAACVCQGTGRITPDVVEAVAALVLNCEHLLKRIDQLKVQRREIREAVERLKRLKRPRRNSRQKRRVRAVAEMKKEQEKGKGDAAIP